LEQKLGQDKGMKPCPIKLFPDRIIWQITGYFSGHYLSSEYKVQFFGVVWNFAK
jgi:hypothetical protein